MIATPLQPLVRISEQLGIDLYTKRDDLYSFTGGGNKARKLQRIIPSIGSKGFNALVTNGGSQSNHARATALIAAEKGWPCKLILHGEPIDSSKATGNLMLIYLSGADVRFVRPEQISKALDDARFELESKGYQPYQIPGGGHCLDGTLAYVDAVSELKRQCDDSSWRPNCIILPSGTGTTQAGINAGVNKEGLNVKVIGISVARKNPRGRDVVINAYSEVCQHLGIPYETNDIDFRDEWIDNGYEKADEGVFNTINWAARTDGLILDPTYTGKAMRALISIVKQGKISEGSRVLFWHTGGLLNLISSQTVLNYL